MKLQMFVVYCIIQTIYSLDDLDVSDDDVEQYLAGGSNAPDNYAPFVCSLQDRREHYCGGTIISYKWVVTSCYCLQDVYAEDEKNIEVMVGTNFKKGGTYYQIERFVRHPKFDVNTRAYDIALLDIKGGITFTDRVQPIILARFERTEGDEFEMTGWGMLGPGNPLPTKLQLVKIKALSRDQCQKLDEAVDLNKNVFCAVPTTYISACKGDRGSPVVDRSGPAPILFGFASRVFCTTDRKYPMVFTKMTHFYDWVTTHTSV